jgi:putative FmdB family regulatory protein
MPTYEYRCPFCHQTSEAFQRMSDAPLVICPHCGKEGLERIVSGGAGVIYKGEGWYVTDYSKKSSGGKEEATKTDAEPDTAKTETTPDTAKPDAPKTETSSSLPKTTTDVSE